MDTKCTLIAYPSHFISNDLIWNPKWMPDVSDFASCGSLIHLSESVFFWKPWVFPFLFLIFLFIVHLQPSCIENWMEGMLTDHHIPKLESRCGGCWLSQVRSFMSSKSWRQHLAGERAGGTVTLTTIAVTYFTVIIDMEISVVVTKEKLCFSFCPFPFSFVCVCGRVFILR